MNMIEKVARSLCWANGGDPDLSLGGDKQNFLWMEYVHQARRAIEAMRDPTKEMIEAGNDAALDHVDACTDSFGDPSGITMEVTLASATLAAMIDAALSEAHSDAP